MVEPTMLMSTENVYRSLSSTLYISKIFAICTFRVRRYGYKKSISGCIYSVIFCILFLYHTLTEIINLKVGGDFLFVVLDRIQIVESVVSTIVTLLCGLIHTRRIIEWFDEIYGYDRIMKQSFRNPFYNSSHRKIRKIGLVSSWTISLYFITIVITDTVCYFPTSTVSIGNTNGIVTYTFPMFTSSLLVLQFSGAMLVIRERFGWINRELQRLVGVWRKQSRLRKLYVVEAEFKNLGCDEEMLIEILENLRQKYYHLHDLTEEVNTIFALPLTMIILQAFLSLVVYSLYFVKGDEKNTWIRTLLYRYISAGFLIMSSFQILVLSYVSSWLSQEAETTAFILHGMDNISDSINDFVEHFSYQILLMKTEITASSLFKIDKTLVFKIVALVTNYLVVCVQLDI